MRANEREASLGRGSSRQRRRKESTMCRGLRVQGIGGAAHGIMTQSGHPKLVGGDWGAHNRPHWGHAQENQRQASHTKRGKNRPYTQKVVSMTSVLPKGGAQAKASNRSRPNPGYPPCQDLLEGTDERQGKLRKLKGRRR